MTPQERDLITSLLERLKTQAGQPKDADAAALISRGLAEQPDAPYLLVQTVLVQDMALHAAQSRVADLERDLAAAKAAPPQQPTSFLGSAARGSVPSAGSWLRPSQPQPPPSAAPGWASAAAPAAPMMGAPMMGGGMGSGFLRQAAATAAGVAGGALLFQGIESLFGPHYGGGWLSGIPSQPGITETVINNYYDDDRSAPDERGDDRQADRDDGGSDSYADDQDVSDQDVADIDTGQDFSDDGNYDV
jgi:uncharacterized protein